MNATTFPWGEIESLVPSKKYVEFTGHNHGRWKVPGSTICFVQSMKNLNEFSGQEMKKKRIADA